ncbi:peptidoglycan-binding protein [Mesorhizobium sp. CN2-181]|uniref:peptidoglycan-binding protein n=1 Tax=Mesorhizobium yinganensis TaxID=3157707 RepID=UPI0032B7BE75
MHDENDDEEDDSMEDPSGGDDMADDDLVQRFRPLLDFIALHEVGTTGSKGYNTSLNFGRHLPNGREQNLVSKTLDEIDKLQTFMRRSSESSAIGRYQIVQKTLQSLRRKLGLSGRHLYSQALQDRLGAVLIKGRGRSVAGLGKEWTSLQNVSPTILLAKYDARDPEELDPDVDDIHDGGAQPKSLAQLLQILLKRLQQKGTIETPDEGDWPVLKMGVNNEEAVKRLQALLNELRYYTGGTDGKFGSLTRGAVALFQIDNGLPVTGAADAATWAALTNGSSRPLSEGRVAMTADDLRQLNSETIKNADWVNYSGGLAALLGGLGVVRGGTCTLDPTISSTLCAAAPQGTNASAAASAVQNVELWQNLLRSSTDPNIAPVSQALETIRQFLQNAAPSVLQGVEQTTGSDLMQLLTSSLVGLLPGGWAGSLLALGLGFGIRTFGRNIINRRVADQRDGRHIGPKTR